MTSKQNFYNKGFTPLENSANKTSGIKKSSVERQHPSTFAGSLTGFTPIGKLLKNTAKEHNLETAMYRHKTLKNWQNVVSGFIEEAQDQTKAVDFKKGILTVACLSREVAYEIKLMAERIIEALNEVVGKRVIYAIYVEV
jgi:predicted nucleic acid-binding Zn ribbon protein